MNRYEENLRKNVARNLLRLTIEGLESDIDKSKMTRPDKNLQYGRLTAKKIAAAVTRFITDAEEHRRYWSDITPDVKKRLPREKHQKTQPLSRITETEVTKSKNWDTSKTTPGSMISSVKISAIRDWLTSIDSFKKYFSVELTDDERYYSIVDFLTNNHGNATDLQKRRTIVSPGENRTLRGEYLLIRQSLRDSSEYIVVNMYFNSLPAGGQTYQSRAKISRDQKLYDAIGHGFCFYTIGCFVLTGKYETHFNANQMTTIDHFVLHDDGDNNVLDGNWSTIDHAYNEPRAIRVVLFNNQSQLYSEIKKLEPRGRILNLPQGVQDRLNNSRDHSDVV